MYVQVKTDHQGYAGKADIYIITGGIEAVIWSTGEQYIYQGCKLASKEVISQALAAIAEYEKPHPNDARDLANILLDWELERNT
jgi:hypothetical protein